MFSLTTGLMLTASALHLPGLLQEAREKNPDLLAAEAQVRAMSAGVAPAAALDDPMLMLQLWNAPIDFSSVPIMLQVTQNIPLGGKLEARRAVAQADAKASEANRAGRVRDIEADVARAYFDLFLASRTAAIDDDIGRTLRQMLDAAASRAATGTGDPVDELKAQGEILKVSADRELALAQQSFANARLAVLVDRDPSEPLGIPVMPAVVKDLPPEKDLRDRALTARPELVAGESMIASAEAQQRLTKAARIPDLGVSAGVMYAFGGMAPHTFLFAGVQGNLPLFGGSKLDPRDAAAAAQVESLRHSQRSLRNRIFAEIAEAYAQVLAESHLVGLHHDLLPLAQRTLDSALSSYATGRGSFLMVIDSERELQMHRMDLISHLAAYEQRLVDLERAVGSDLGLVAASESGSETMHGLGVQ